MCNRFSFTCGFHGYRLDHSCTNIVYLSSDAIQKIRVHLKLFQVIALHTFVSVWRGVVIRSFLFPIIIVGAIWIYPVVFAAVSVTVHKDPSHPFYSPTPVSNSCSNVSMVNHVSSIFAGLNTTWPFKLLGSGSGCGLQRSSHCYCIPCSFYSFKGISRWSLRTLGGSSRYPKGSSRKLMNRGRKLMTGSVIYLMP